MPPLPRKLQFKYNGHYVVNNDMSVQPNKETLIKYVRRYKWSTRSKNIINSKFISSQIYKLVTFLEKKK